MRKGEGIECSEDMEDMLERRRKKKKKHCDKENEKYSENEDEVNYYSEIDDICQNIPLFPTKPFTNFREEIAMSKNKYIEGKSYDEKLSLFVGRTLFYLFQSSQIQSTNKNRINGKDTIKGVEKKIDLDDTDIFDEVNKGSD